MGVSVVTAAEVGTLSLAFFAFVAFAFAVAGFAGFGFIFTGEAALFAAADGPVGVEPFEYELGGGGGYAIGLVLTEYKRLGLLHEALYRFQFADHGGRIRGFVHLERAPEIEPLDDLGEIDAFEEFVVDLADGGADQVAGHRVAALELAFVFQFELAGDGGEGRVD